MPYFRLSPETLKSLFSMITMERLNSSMGSLSLTSDSGYSSPELSGETQALNPDTSRRFNGERGLLVRDETKEQGPDTLIDMSTCVLNFEEGRRLKAKTAAKRRQSQMDEMPTEDVEPKKRRVRGAVRSALSRGTRETVVFQRRVKKMHRRTIGILKPRQREADMEPSVHTDCDLPPAVLSSRSGPGTQLYSQVCTQEKAQSHGLHESAACCVQSFQSNSAPQRWMWRQSSRRLQPPPCFSLNHQQLRATAVRNL